MEINLLRGKMKKKEKRNQIPECVFSPMGLNAVSSHIFFYTLATPVVLGAADMGTTIQYAMHTVSLLSLLRLIQY